MPSEIRSLWCVTSIPYSRGTSASSIYVISTPWLPLFFKLGKLTVNLFTMNQSWLWVIRLIINHISLKAFHLSLRHKNNGCGPSFTIGHLDGCRQTSSLKVWITSKFEQSTTCQCWFTKQWFMFIFYFLEMP